MSTHHRALALLVLSDGRGQAKDAGLSGGTIGSLGSPVFRVGAIP